jgi:hypothetical protein
MLSDAALGLQVLFGTLARTIVLQHRCLSRAESIGWLIGLIAFE